MQDTLSEGTARATQLAPSVMSLAPRRAPRRRREIWGARSEAHAAPVGGRRSEREVGGGGGALGALAGWGARGACAIDTELM
jgi:hypothetical protein